VGNNWCSHSMSHDRGSHGVSHRVSHSVDHGGSMSHSHGVGNSMGHRDSLGVDSLPVIGHLSHVAVNVVGVVVDSLGAAVREVDLVGSLDNTGAIVRLSSIEVGVGVVISDSVVVGVGGNLVRVDLNRSSMGDSMNHRSSVNNRGGMNHRGSMDKRGSMGHHRVGHSMGNRVGHSVGYRVGNDRGSMGNDSSLTKVRGKA